MKIFYAYSRRDEQLRDDLEDHLASVKRQGLVESWHDRKIAPGAEWHSEIADRLDSADLILLLVSSNFLSSEFCYGTEMKRALERHERGEARVIPIILRPCDWGKEPFAKLQVLPRDANPVTRWDNLDEAWTSIAKAIRHIASENFPPVPQPNLDPISPIWSQDKANTTQSPGYQAGGLPPTFFPGVRERSSAPNEVT